MLSSFGCSRQLSPLSRSTPVHSRQRGQRTCRRASRRASCQRWAVSTLPPLPVSCTIQAADPRAARHDRPYHPAGPIQITPGGTARSHRSLYAPLSWFRTSLIASGFVFGDDLPCSEPFTGRLHVKGGELSHHSAAVSRPSWARRIKVLPGVRLASSRQAHPECPLFRLPCKTQLFS